VRTRQHLAKVADLDPRVERRGPQVVMAEELLHVPHVLVCLLAYAMYRTLDRLAKAKHLHMTARRVFDLLAGIKSGDVILPLVDGRELRLRRVSRPDPHQAEILTRLGLDLPERTGTDIVHMPGVAETQP
jgi:hypothetical protein